MEPVEEEQRERKEEVDQTTESLPSNEIEVVDNGEDQLRGASSSPTPSIAATEAAGLRQRAPSRRPPRSSSSSSSTVRSRHSRAKGKNEAAGGEKKGLGTRVGGALADSVKSVGARMFLMCILLVVGLAIAAVAAFAFCWAFFPVATAPIAGQRAIASLETITLGGVEQSILIRAEDASNPIVLLLHGGPGLPLMPFRSGFAALEKDFVVVYWDQYGSGKSCEWSTFLVSSSSAPSPASAWEHDHHHRHGSSDTDEPADDAANGQRQPSSGRTPCRRCGAHRWDRFGDFEEDEPAGPQRRIDLASTLQDTEELVSYLCRRFHQRAVALVAHDSGSVVAMQFARQHPELVRSVFLVAPLIDFSRQHATALEWTLDKARSERQYALLSQLETTRGGVTLPLANATQLLKLRRAVAELGGDMRRGGFVLKLLHHIFSASEYGVGEKLTLVPCGIQSAAHQFNDLRQVNLTEQVRAVEVPVAMACGKWDRLAPCALVEEYLHALRTTAASASSPSAVDGDAATATTVSPTTASPHVRELVVFAQSAHWPFIEEGDIFVARLREHLNGQL